MKINEVENLVGITKKNIRFYEEQGLLSPRRNAENGYRDYGEADVDALRRIKLLRKLGLPIGEIRLMQNGTHTVGDGMRRHLVTLERERRDLEQAVTLCTELQGEDIPVSKLDAEAILARMEEMERNGASFQNKHTGDVRTRYIAPVAVTLIMVTLMLALSALFIWAYRTSPEGAPPFWFLLLIVGIFAAVAAGVVLALSQRIKEIRKGEIDDAKHY